MPCMKKGLERQERDSPPVSSQERRAAVFTRINGVSTARCAPHRFQWDFVCLCSRRTVRARGTGVSFANRPVGVPSCPTPPWCAPPPRRPPPRHDPPVVYTGFGFDKFIPVESKTRTYPGRVGTGRRTAGRRGRAGTGSTGRRRRDCSPRRQQTLLLPRRWKNDLLGVSWKNEQWKSYANRWRNKTRG